MYKTWFTEDNYTEWAVQTETHNQRRLVGQKLKTESLLHLYTSFTINSSFSFSNRGHSMPEWSKISTNSFWLPRCKQPTTIRSVVIFWRETKQDAMHS